MYLSSQQHPPTSTQTLHDGGGGGVISLEMKEKSILPEKNAIMRRLECGSEEKKNARVVMPLKFFQVKHACMVCVCVNEKARQRER